MNDLPTDGQADHIAERIRWGIERFGDIEPDVLRTLTHELDQQIQTTTAPRDIALAYTVALLNVIREKVEAASRNEAGLTLREWLISAGAELSPEGVIRPMARIRDAWLRGDAPEVWRNELMIRDWIDQREEKHE